jgi:putative heme iron utilization protein
MAQKAAFAVLSTNSQKLAGYPLGSIVGFAVDDQGRPFFSFRFVPTQSIAHAPSSPMPAAAHLLLTGAARGSTMSAHTQNLLADPRASLCVTEAAFRGAADARVTLVGSVRKVRPPAGPPFPPAPMLARRILCASWLTLPA